MALRGKKTTQTLVAGGKPVVITTKPAEGLITRLIKLVTGLTNAGTRLFGIGLAGVGAAHLVAPQPFEVITKPAFPEDTRNWVYRNGVTETLIGLALANPKTRVAGGAGSVAYVVFLISRLVRNAGNR